MRTDRKVLCRSAALLPSGSDSVATLACIRTPWVAKLPRLIWKPLESLTMADYSPSQPFLGPVEVNTSPAELRQVTKVHKRIIVCCDGSVFDFMALLPDR